MMGIWGLYKTKKNWGGCRHLLLVYDASKLSTENSEFPPSV